VKKLGGKLNKALVAFVNSVVLIPLPRDRARKRKEREGEKEKASREGEA
jgi:hypothetical protein